VSRFLLKKKYSIGQGESETYMGYKDIKRAGGGQVCSWGGGRALPEDLRTLHG